MDARRLEMARRAKALLEGDRGVTGMYALAAVDAELVDEDDLRGRWTGKGMRRRWFMA